MPNMKLFVNGKRIYTVRLDESTDKQWHFYNCPDCKNPVFRHNGTAIAEVAGVAPLKVGIEIPCRNRYCGRVVIVEGFSHNIL